MACDDPVPSAPDPASRRRDRRRDPYRFPRRPFAAKREGLMKPRARTAVAGVIPVTPPHPDRAPSGRCPCRGRGIDGPRPAFRTAWRCINVQSLDDKVRSPDGMGLLAAVPVIAATGPCAMLSGAKLCRRFGARSRCLNPPAGRIRPREHRDEAIFGTRNSLRDSLPPVPARRGGRGRTAAVQVRVPPCHRGWPARRPARRTGAHGPRATCATCLRAGLC
jgi:hypothetical protein